MPVKLMQYTQQQLCYGKLTNLVDMTLIFTNEQIFHSVLAVTFKVLEAVLEDTFKVLEAVSALV